MSKVEDLLSDAESLPLAERRRLAELLLEQVALETEDNDSEVGLRGLRAWTESAVGEDWAEYYSDSLRSALRSALRGTEASKK